MTEPAPLRLLFTPREAAQALSVCEVTLRRLPIPRVMIGRAVRYALDDLQDWIDRTRTEANGECEQ